MKRHVLIVDDEPTLGLLLSSFVRRAGRLPVAAVSSRQALTAFKPGKFCLALVDVTLGDGMDGLTLAGELQEKEPRLLIAMMTGTPAEADRVKKAGFRLLIKPFDLGKVDLLLRAAP